MRAHDDLVVISRRRLVAAACVHHGNEAFVIPLHVAVSKSQLTHQFHASDFKPDEVIGMIDHSHLIGLGVAHPQPALADYARVITPSAHLPLHRGLRFSRNDVMPSRKSAVVRIRALSCTAWPICWSSCSAMNPLIRRLVARIDDGLFSMSCAASSRARIISTPGSTTSLTRP